MPRITPRTNTQNLDMPNTPEARGALVLRIIACLQWISDTRRPFSINEMASGIEIGRETARVYLGILNDVGLVRSMQVRKKGGVSGPARLYVKEFKISELG